jgi:hypothetical protein
MWEIGRVHINPANRRRITRLLHNIRIWRAIRTIDTAIPGEPIRPAGHATARDESASALLARHAGQLPFARFGTLRRLLCRERQGKQQKTSQEEFAHG